MATYPYPSHSPTESHLARLLIVGFISGFISVLIFHQGVYALLHSAGFTPGTPYSMHATAPWGVPQVWSLAFWGGVWGIILAACLGRLDGASLIIASIIFGAVLPTLVVWFVISPLKGQPVMGGGNLHAIATALIVNGAWGLGTGIGLLLFGHSHHRGERTIAG